MQILRFLRKHLKSRISPILSITILFCAYFSVSILLQRAAGASQSEFGASADESAHFVTGMMVRQYIEEGFPHSPISFAERYYIHYPQVSFGHWPPVLYILEALWTLVIGCSRYSVLLMMASIAAMLAVLIHWQVRTHFSLFLAFPIAIIFLSLDLVQRHTAMVMADLPLTLFTFVAALCLIGFLDRNTWSSAVCFGIFASLAIMTKANALTMAFVPVLAVLATRQPRRLWTVKFWLPAAIVLALCGPFYLWSLPMLSAGTEASPVTLSRVLFGILPYTFHWVPILGHVLFLPTLMGLAAFFLAPLFRGKLDNRWAVFGILLIVTQIFHLLTPGSLDPRKLFQAIPAALLFAAAGIYWLASYSWSGRMPTAWRLPIIAGIFLLLYGSTQFKIYHSSPRRGFSEVAKHLLGRPDLDRAVFLVSSNTIGERALIAEIASREPSPRHIILRGDKYLSSSTWSGLNYKLLYTDPDQAHDDLIDVPVKILIIHSSSGIKNPPHLELLRQMVKKHPDSWHKLQSYPEDHDIEVKPDQVDVYELVKVPASTSGKIKIDLRDKLNRTLTFDIKGEK